MELYKTWTSGLSLAYPLSTIEFVVVVNPYTNGSSEQIPTHIWLDTEEAIVDTSEVGQNSTLT